MIKSIETHNLTGKVVEVGGSVDEDMSIETANSKQRPSSLITKALQPFEGRNVHVRIEIRVTEIQ